ncbi:glycine-rich protein DC7.1-like [Apium graveolens]|uniref:glycine-rich protein DC7.1-like n=1 Tax=Apium graveolens TaxID=4045 RepID=UPI003D7BEAFC
MGSKIVLLLGLSIAFVLLISSEVAARDLAKTTQKNLNRAPAAEGASLDGGGYRYGQVSGSRKNRELEGHGTLEGEKVQSNCSSFCRRIYSRCCSAAEAQALKDTQVKPHN